MIFNLIPIGVVHVPFDDEVVRNSFNGVSGSIEIFQDFADGLIGIEEFSHIIVVAYLHKTLEHHRRTLIVRPRRLVKLGLKLEDIPEVGVFCTDSPHRPNPIGITIVRLLKREGRFLHVDGLDLFDKTPVIDLRPYTPDRVVSEPRLPTWYLKFIEMLGIRSI